jgi:hypothetical protein
VTAAERLAEIRDRHRYDVDLGRWDQDEVGMLDALDAVLALCDRYERADERHQPPSGQAVAAKVYNAIIDALGGES